MGPRKLNWGQAYWTSSAEAGTWFLRGKGWRSLHTPAFCSDFLHSRVKEFQKWDLLGIMRDPKSFLKIEIYMRLFHSKGWPAEALRHCFPPKLWGCHVALIQALHGGTLPQVMLQFGNFRIFVPPFTFSTHVTILFLFSCNSHMIATFHKKLIQRDFVEHSSF